MQQCWPVGLGAFGEGGGEGGGAGRIIGESYCSSNAWNCSSKLTPSTWAGRQELVEGILAVHLCERAHITVDEGEVGEERLADAFCTCPGDICPIGTASPPMLSRKHQAGRKEAQFLQERAEILETCTTKLPLHVFVVRRSKTLRMLQVSPVGMSTRLPVILSHSIVALQPDFFFLGGGEVDLKLGMHAAEFVKAYQPLVVDCTNEEEPAQNAGCLS